MSEKQPTTINEVAAWHVTKTVTGNVLTREPIHTGASIPFGEDYFSTTSVELSEEGQPQTVRRIKGRDEVIEVRPIRKTVERFNLFGNWFRQEIEIPQKNSRA